MRRTAVDLFSGIGGFALACEWAGVETVAFAEINDYASRVLRKHWPGVRNYGNVRNIPAVRDVWLVTGGVPCQPASVAGKRRGTEDDRWLWPEALAVVERVRSEWVLFENPTGILSLNDGVEFERICLALEGQGYEVQPIIIPACAVNAPHRRNRVWILAHSDGRRGWSESGNALYERGRTGQAWGASISETARWSDGFANSHAQSASKDVEYPTDFRLSQPKPESRGAKRIGSATSVRTQPTSASWWATEPNVGRVANGIPKRVHRLRCLGNAIIPQVAYQLIKRMIEADMLG